MATAAEDGVAAAAATSDSESLVDGERAEREPTAELFTTEAAAGKAPVGAAQAVNGEPTASVPAVKVMNKGEILLKTIAALKDEQKKMKADKKQNAKILRAAERRRQRLKSKAKQLSQEDLLSLVFIRDEEARKRQSRTEGESAAEDVEGLTSAPSDGQPPAPAAGTQKKAKVSPK